MIFNATIFDKFQQDIYYKNSVYNTYLEDIYLIFRIGSFFSVPYPRTSNIQDQDLYFPGTSAEELILRCKAELKALPKNANRGNERQFKLRTLNSGKNMDENKPSRGNNVHI